jgi:hypothetical protein
MSALELNDPAWTRAVETVLAAWLKAVRVGEVDEYLDGDCRQPV